MSDAPERFSLSIRNIDSDKPEIYAKSDPDGGWVRYAEHRAALDTAEARMAAADRAGWERARGEAVQVCDSVAAGRRGQDLPRHSLSAVNCAVQISALTYTPPTKEGEA